MTSSVKFINTSINNNCRLYMENSDRELFNQIKKVAENLCKSHTPVVLISGPSGSGKTTSSYMLRDILNDMGLVSHSVSMDNYFNPLSLKELELLSQGRMDLESPLRIDSELLSSQIEMIIKGVKTEIPSYDFVNSKRIYKGDFIQRKENEIIIFEGIHALNNNVIKIDDNETFKIYVSVRTRVENNGIILHPSKIRLLRRIIRDHIHRGRSSDDTLQLFQSVEQGEHKYIMPYKYRADCNIDTFIPYELSVYKNFIEKNNIIIRKNPVTSDLLKIIDSVKSVEGIFVSESSLIREFIGNQV